MHKKQMLAGTLAAMTLIMMPVSGCQTGTGRQAQVTSQPVTADVQQMASRQTKEETTTEAVPSEPAAEQSDNEATSETPESTVPAEDVPAEVETENAPQENTTEAQTEEPTPEPETEAPTPAEEITIQETEPTTVAAIPETEPTTEAAPVVPDSTSRIVIPAVGIDVPYITAADNASSEELQSIVDDPEFACYIPDSWSHRGGNLYADHSNQGFAGLSNVRAGDTIYINGKTMTAVRAEEGVNDGWIHYNSTGNLPDEGGDYLYTCLDGGAKRIWIVEAK